MRFKVLYIVFSLFFLISCSDRDEIVKDFNPDPVTNFQSLWEILDQRYCYFTSKGIDWEDVYDKYLPKAQKVQTVFELFDLMEDMLDILNDGHVNLYSPFDVSVCTGWYSDYPTDFYQHLIPGYIVGELRSVGGFQYGMIKNTRIGYIRYSSFTKYPSPLTLAYIDAYWGKTDGIIIDVRNNGGGNLSYSASLAASFFKEKCITGYIQHKTDIGHDDFSDPRPIITDPQSASIDWTDRNVIVLSNRMCYSATNDFIVRCKMAPEVTVVGGITGGGGGMPLSQELPNGWMIRFSAVPMYDSDMLHTEFGVTPDIEVHITDDNLNAGCDAILETAIEEIKKKYSIPHPL